MSQNGKIDISTIIPIDDILVKGISYVSSLMNETNNIMGWDSSWRYFKKTWIVEYNPKYWNISLYKDTKELLETEQTTHWKDIIAL